MEKTWCDSDVVTADVGRYKNHLTFLKVAQKKKLCIEPQQTALILPYVPYARKKATIRLLVISAEKLGFTEGNFDYHALLRAHDANGLRPCSAEAALVFFELFDAEPLGEKLEVAMDAFPVLGGRYPYCYRFSIRRGRHDRYLSSWRGGCGAQTGLLLKPDDRVLFAVE
jgi:hypothetical protein